MTEEPRTTPLQLLLMAVFGVMYFALAVAIVVVLPAVAIVRARSAWAISAEHDVRQARMEQGMDLARPAVREAAIRRGICVGARLASRA
jgi:hypothetical protein